MKTRKKAIVYAILLIWLGVNIATFICYGAEYAILSNGLFLTILIILVVLKNTFPSFNNWLEGPSV